jgi:hypothetical protein
MFGADCFFMHFLSFLMSQAENPSRSLGKSFHASHGNLLFSKRL